MHYHTRCSCPNEQCRTAEHIRLLFENMDNSVILYARCRYLEQLPDLLTRLCEDRAARLTAWQSDQDRYRPYLVAHAKSVEDLARLRQHDLDWGYQEHEALDKHIEQQQRCVADHATYAGVLLSHLARSVTPACLEGMRSELQAHIMRLMRRLKRISLSASTNAEQLKQTYQLFRAEDYRLSQGATAQVQTSQQMGLLVQNLGYIFTGIGHPRSFSQAQAAHHQQRLQNAYDNTRKHHQNFLWYSKKSWELIKTHAFQQELTALQAQFSLWNTLLEQWKGANAYQSVRSYLLSSHP